MPTIRELNSSAPVARLAITNASSATGLRFDVQAQTPAFTYIGTYFHDESSLGSTVPSLGPTYDVTDWTVRDVTDSSDPTSELGAALAAGTLVLVIRRLTPFTADPLPSDYGIRVFELGLAIDYTSAAAYPLRRYPRAGATGPTRQWPRRITRRPGTY